MAEDNRAWLVPLLHLRTDATDTVASRADNLHFNSLVTPRARRWNAVRQSDVDQTLAPSAPGHSVTLGRYRIRHLIPLHWHTSSHILHLSHTFRLPFGRFANALAKRASTPATPTGTRIMVLHTPHLHPSMVLPQLGHLYSFTASDPGAIRSPGRSHSC